MEEILTRWAKDAFVLLWRSDRTKRELSFDVARTVGRQAARIGMTEEQVKRWLQNAYGSVWVRCSGLVPGVDLKELSKFILQWYRQARNER